MLFLYIFFQNVLSFLLFVNYFYTKASCHSREGRSPASNHNNPHCSGLDFSLRVGKNDRTETNSKNRCVSRLWKIIQNKV